MNELNIQDENLDTSTHILLRSQTLSPMELQLLVDKGLNINIQNKQGETLLHMCFKYYMGVNTQLIEAMIRNGGDVNILDNKGISVLYNILRSCPDIDKHLLYKIIRENRDKLNIKCGGYTYLHIAAWLNNIDLTDVLLRNGCIPQQGLDGKMPFEDGNKYYNSWFKETLQIMNRVGSRTKAASNP